VAETNRNELAEGHSTGLVGKGERGTKKGGRQGATGIVMQQVKNEEKLETAQAKEKKKNQEKGRE